MWSTFSRLLDAKKQIGQRKIVGKMKGRVIDYIQYTVVYANQVEGSRAWAVATGNRVTFTRHVALLLFTSTHPEFSAIKCPQISSSINLRLFSLSQDLQKRSEVEFRVKEGNYEITPIGRWKHNGHASDIH